MAFTPPDTVPYNPRTGEMESYPLEHGIFASEMRPNKPFHATLRFDTITRGRSAARFELVDTTTGARYPMFMTDALDVMRNGVRKGGTVTGTWQAGKRGANFGIRLVGK